MTWPTEIAIVDTETPGVSGYLTYQLSNPLTDSDSGNVYPDIVRQVRYNSSGVASIQLAVIDDATTEPSGSWYTVTKTITGAPTLTWIIQPEAAMGASVALGSITPSTPLPPVLPYATSVSVGTTTTGAPGSPASVVNAGTTQVPVLDFTVPAGATGATGATGTAGNTVLYGSGAPSSGLGVNGNFYIDDVANEIYGPKAAGAWPAGTSLIGPTGPTGATGATGAQGPSGTNAVVFALTDAASIATNAALGNVATVTLGGNRTLANPTNPTSGQKMVWRITQDGTGSRTLAFGTAFQFSASVPQPVLTTTPGGWDYIGAIYNAASSTWDVVAVSQGY